MRILLATEPGSGGVGRHIADLATGLVDRGHAVDLVYSPQRAESWFLEKIHALNIRSYAIEMNRFVSWRDSSIAVRLNRLIRKSGGYDIAHGHSSKAGALIRIAAMGTRATCVYTPHALATLNPDQRPFQRAAFPIIERLLSAFADGIICVSEEERQHALELGISPNKLHVVNNGLDTLPEASRCDVRAKLGIDSSDICLGFVGRLAPQKAVDRLITAFSRAYAQNHRLRLVLVGSGPELPSLKALAHDLGVQHRIVFLSDSRGAYLMAGFDIFVLTSRYEAFPYVFLEAAARGLPIVTTRVGGTTAMVNQGFNGFVLPQNDQIQFTQRILEICSQPQLRAEMGKRSTAIAREVTVDTMVEQTIAKYVESISLRTSQTDRSQ